MTDSGLLIAFEGGDGSGKSTQSKLLAERLDAVHTRQAGGTALGAKIRQLTLDSSSADISARAEAMLYMADRAEQADRVVRPALKDGRHVVSDRWAYSSMAYQNARHGLSIGDLEQLSDWATRSLWPDLVFFIDVDPEIGLTRAGGTDHYETSGAKLQTQLRETYHQLAKADPQRWRVIDGNDSIDAIATQVWAEVEPLLVTATN